MGAALCACAGRADDEPHGLYRLPTGKLSSTHKARFKDGLDSSLLQTQSRTETREPLSDEEREAMRHNDSSVRVIHASGNYHLHHSSAGVYGYVVPPEDATESDEIEYYNRQQQLQQQQNHAPTNSGGFTLTLPSRRRTPSMNPTTADAFRTKLREPIMSPRSKMMLLVGTTTEDSVGSASEDADGDRDDRERHHDGDIETCSERDLRRLRSESAVYDVDPADDGHEVEDDEDEYFEFVRIIVPPGPCGVVFQTPTSSTMPPTVEGFVRMYDGTKGPIENSGLVHPGSTLCAINDLEVTTMPLSEVIRALNLSSHLEREFVFRK